ncbi:hypothetical protein D9M70_549820 [compost metagenome]
MHLAFGDVDLRGEGALGHASQSREHLAGLVGVGIDGLLAQDHQARLLLVDDLGQQLGDCERLQAVFAFHLDGPVGAQGQRRAQLFLAGLGADGDDHDFVGMALFFQLDGFFHGDLAEGVERHFEVGGIDGGAGGVHRHLDVVVHDSFDSDQNLHCCVALALPVPAQARV